jgi:hypothetical protein
VTCRTQTAEPVDYRALVPVRHVQVRHVGEGEQPSLLVLCADNRRAVVGEVTAIRNDHHVTVLAYVVLPTIQNRPSRDLPAGFLADLPDNALLRILSEFQLPAGKLPLAALVLQQ